MKLDMVQPSKILQQLEEARVFGGPIIVRNMRMDELTPRHFHKLDFAEQGSRFLVAFGNIWKRNFVMPATGCN